MDAPVWPVDSRSIYANQALDEPTQRKWYRLVGGDVGNEQISKSRLGINLLCSGNRI